MSAGAPLPGSAGRGFMIGLTLTEVALLLFFVLLLLVTDQKKELRRQEQARQELQQANRELREKQASLQELEKLVEQQRRSDPSKRDMTPEEFVRLVRDAQRTREQLRESEQERSRLREENERLRERARDVKAQLAHVKERCGPEGHGPPPCWLDPETGEIEYIFDVTIRENGVVAVPSWPQHRQDDAMAIPGVSEWPTGEVSLGQFRKHAAPVLAWSRQQDPECRHYVRIYDDAVSKEAFKRHLLGVEDYFYKWLSRE
jgi:uncharacterized short protein YbdD (DUF466 family)